MQTLVRNGLILLVTLALAVYAMVPPEKKLKLGKDLAGGATLVYGVNVAPTDPSDTIEKVKAVVKERLDPDGVREISVLAQGADKLEITMPLPDENVKRLKAEFEAELGKLSVASLSADEFERVLALPSDARAKEFDRLSSGDAGRRARMENAARAYDDLKPLREKAGAAQRKIVDLKRQLRDLEKAEPKVQALIDGMQAAITAAEGELRTEAEAVAPMEIAYEAARDSAVVAGLDPADLRATLQLSKEKLRIQGKDEKVIRLDSPRERGMAELEKKYPDHKADIERVTAAWNAYESQRKSLDDPQDIKRILKGAGVLNFRITVDPGSLPQEQEARTQLRAGGPRSVRVEDVRWFKINKIDGWINGQKDLESLEANPAGYFASTRNLVVDQYKGEKYMLLWDRPGLSLTERQGDWQLANAYQASDQLGRPAIDFRMDVIGGNLLGKLTENNVGKPMAVLLDDEVYTAPTLQSRISNQGQISGSFSPAEVDYVIRVLSAGSLKAKLSQDPISESTVGPQLGADNLQKGANAGIWAFIIVGVFMVGYYFLCGFVSMLALLFNTVMIIGAMAMNQAAFTLPGIAGIILTFGQAVDANVLVYERMREEFGRGADLRTAVRLGYSRAMSAIVDGNVTTLIVCVVLGFFGTQEIRGFALTLGIGTATTLFAQLFFTRFVFTLLVERFGLRKVRMLPMLNDSWLGKRLVPNIDWMGMRFISYTITGLLMLFGLGFLVVQGRELLGTEFRGGTAITISLKTDEATGKQLQLKRAEVEDRVKALGTGLDRDNPLANFQTAEVIAVNPDPKDPTLSSTFTVKSLITDPAVAQPPIISAFAKELETRQSLRFVGSDLAIGRAIPAYPINTPIVEDALDGVGGTRTPAGDMYGGVAIVLSDISPAVSVKEITDRLKQARGKADYSDTRERRVRVIVLQGSDVAVKSAVVAVADPELSFFDDENRWTSEVRNREWRLVQDGLTTSQTLASVQAFSPAVASSFQNRAIISVVLSTVLIIIYIWLRFNSFRYSFAAILTTLHDCICSIGFVALATWLFNNMNPLATALHILPFKIDLNVTAAILTTLGYSLNDTIIVMDRIRENRGKLPYASRQVINDSINQTISRTLITSGTTFIAVITLYLFGGEGIRVFAYTMLVGVIIGTYSSIAVAAPLVWVRRTDPHADVPDAASRTAVVPA